MRSVRTLVALGATTALTAGVLALGIGTAGALPAECATSERPITALEAGRFVGYPATSADGDRITFLSSGDLDGTNADHTEEVWLYDRTTHAVTSITATDAVPLVDAPTISTDGSTVAFRSTWDPLGTNADASAEIFLYKVATDDFTQVTTTPAGRGSRTPALDADGSTIAIESTGDLDPGGNAAGDSEIFLSTDGGTTWDQVTNGSGGEISQLPQLDDAGDDLVFLSETDLAGPDPGFNRELYHLHVGDPIEQLTQTENAVDDPDISGDGRYVSASHDGNPVGSNLDANKEIFVYDLLEDDVRQITVTTPGISNVVSALDADGSRVAYISAGDPLGTNTDGSEEVWLFDVPGDKRTQVTRSTFPGDPEFFVELDGPGTSVLYASKGDPVGTNDDDERDLFLASCGASSQTFTDVGATHPFLDEIEWMAAARISEGYTPGPTYRPSAAVSRAAMSAFMYRLAGEPTFFPPPTPSFSDVGTSHPFFAEVQWMKSTGVSTGYTDGTYRPGDPVTRQSMSAFMYRLAGEPTFTAPGAATFTDVSLTHPFFDEIEWMASEDITTGYAPGPTYRPSTAVSRQAMSAFMLRLANGPGVDVPTIV